MLDFLIGTDSNGSKISKSLPTLRNLFVSYLEDKEIKAIQTSIISEGINIGRLLLITRESNLIDISNCLFADTYIYNNPERGTIKKKNQLFAQIIKEQKNRKDKTSDNKRTLIMIDDMWQFYPKFTSKIAINQFRQLLQDGYKHNVHFVIGSILPYRNLLLQLLQGGNTGSNRNIIPTLGAEIMISPDGLIFFRDYITENQEIYYPINNKYALVEQLDSL